MFREGEKPKNPMVELFYGRFLAVGVLEGEIMCLLTKTSSVELKNKEIKGWFTLIAVARRQASLCP